MPEPADTGALMVQGQTGSPIATPATERIARRHLEHSVETQFEGDHDVDDRWVLARRR